MDQLHIYAYESLGWWHITVHYRTLLDNMQAGDATLYRGTHVPIDEEDPEVRTVLILHQVTSDLNRAIAGNRDNLLDGPAHH